AVLADIAIIDPLTLVFLLIWQKHDEMMLSISRTFHALKKSLKILYQDYNQVVTLYNEQGLPKPKRACVKLLAETRYASKVLTSLIIPENWLIVYMEYLEDYSTLNYFASINKQNHLREKIKEIIRYLHDAGHVHGDLHEGNILVCQLTNNDFDVKLIDFEWCVEVSSACYSHFINHADIE
ncbi:3632_t:CDS:2, partial [Scutellospora calospora]